jgi:hypothetical protein
MIRKLYKKIMTHLLDSIRNHYNDFFKEYRPYNFPLYIDPEEEIDKYQFPDSDAAAKLTNIFHSIIQNDDTTLSEFLQEPLYERRFNSHVDYLKTTFNCKEYGNRENMGLILEHPDCPGWLIKKNYNSSWKLIHFGKIPTWMIPRDLVISRCDEVHSSISPRIFRSDNPIENDDLNLDLAVLNGVINPLRVVILKRGEEWVRKREAKGQTTHIVPCEEYCFPLPNVPPDRPLSERVVVLSKKMELFSSQKTFDIFTQIYKEDPGYFRTLTTQICDFIKYTRITDMHLGNVLFLKPVVAGELPRKVTFVDGEPIGSLIDIAMQDKIDTGEATDFNRFDPGVFSLLGLLYLKSVLENYLEERLKKIREPFREAEGLNFIAELRAAGRDATSDEMTIAIEERLKKIPITDQTVLDEQQMINAFCAVIDRAERMLIRERLWCLAKNYIPILWIAFFAIASVRAICDCIGFTHERKRSAPIASSSLLPSISS